MPACLLAPTGRRTRRRATGRAATTTAVVLFYRYSTLLAAAPLVSRAGERWVPFGLSPLRFSFVE